MTDITIIGSGNMARAIGTRAVAAGRSVQILDRTPPSSLLNLAAPPAPAA
jgi:3-hydroxyisobutyrate dehydrogenase-like beta-hydroxyacid dehydrogenase